MNFFQVHNMKVLFAYLLMISTILFSDEPQKIDEKPMVLVIPSYKNKDWYKRNLDSTFSQNYSNYRIIYVDDASPDGTGDLVEKYVKEKNKQALVHLIKNPKRVGALANLYTAIHLCKPEEIVCTLDGDDWLSNHDVLKRVNKEYQDPQIWMTYGQHEQWMGDGKRVYQGGSEIYPENIIKNREFRKYKWVASHLRTFYAGLFHKIDKEDLMYKGEFFPMSYDYAIMYPMLEMASHHHKFIPEVLYVYNIATPLNDLKVNYHLQQECCREIKQYKKPYAPLTTLF